ncbi:isoleucine--tRNA ligase [Neoehrlichia mikurensis]|uniref:Isoleucine--tRNA ligase n=1 Tax=Neoehrlichia mikurensis TaxID=89586 RepID=A0A9Q9F3E6_9RICK|nr:isoleucine--tRNA ligase [Neoehrlichia mikurensis]QXK91983.1 isoleucine--tRNA ligase [Neoehrlichia mikurensis]QXK92440.1 isoleucine--tRNA ligase [Neoehrlichia mikurensis]QXK93675.1 isoleucine--tRNA ligase [Neoehrlichia mikurensis]UTO55355.1 isoleucine--tRNA ligase [Neoehrlichia mikurensis]UTO56274.1 isoleucine--tRNA ligase [Neoehrlichia mikurensis]
MKKYYPDANNNPHFPSIEKEVLQYWDDNAIFQQSIDNNPQDKHFIFYDGPPFANGLPHYGHLLTGFIKDTIARYKTMMGFRVERRFGWDCHGLPAEMLAEKELKISGKSMIEQFGIENFNQYCRDSVMKFSKDWKKYVNRQARWVNFDNDYKTMDNSFMESVMWAFHELWNKGLIYESIRVVPYSWACQTPLSNFETKIDNSYREKISKSITVIFELLQKPKFVQDHIKSCKILVWTTTPWTLPVNFALAINQNIKYIAVIIDLEVYIFAQNYLNTFKNHCTKNNIQYQIYNDNIDCNDLISLNYKPLLPYFKNIQNAFYIIDADFVNEKEGTGIVHISPGFGEEDFTLCKKYNIPDVGEKVSELLSIICPIQDDGKFTTIMNDLANYHIFDTNDIIIRKLKEQNSWFNTEQYLHNYPHCWRTDTPLIYRAMSSWYIEVTKLKEKMIQLNKNVNWIPSHIKDGQFGKWLEGIKDWSISRNRFWGTPIPVWKSDNPEYPRIDVYGSIKKIFPNVKALEEDFDINIEDLHRPYIDTLTRPNPDDPTKKSMMRRIPDVFDCWFESGSMPYAQVHYPFENKALFDNNFPADFITEYIAQTRGWFYTLFVLSTAIFNTQPFNNCICHGVVLDIKGQKLSKRLNNYTDPMEIFEKYGADAMRFLMLSHPISVGGELLLDIEGEMIRDVLKNIIKPIWNSYTFFTIYANTDNVKAVIIEHIDQISNIMDLYIINECINTIQAIFNAMETNNKQCGYNIQLSCEYIKKFFDILNNWYIRRCRERFWSSQKNTDKINAYNTLYTVLFYILRSAAPFLPIITESIWQKLDFNQEASIHLSKFPHKNPFQFTTLHANNMQYMKLSMEVCNTALSLRNTHNIRIRQPLNKIIIFPYNCEELSDLPMDYQNIILNETNIKKLTINYNIKSIADFNVKLNFSILGARIPNKIKYLISLIKSNKWKLLKKKQLLIGDEFGDYYILNEEEYTLQFTINNPYASAIMYNNVLVGAALIDSKLTNELILEGLARDIVRSIQKIRKDSNFSITDHISVTIQTENNQLHKAIEYWEHYIKQQTLSDNILVTHIQQNIAEECYYSVTKDNNACIFIKKVDHKL